LQEIGKKQPAAEQRILEGLTYFGVVGLLAIYFND